MILICTVKTNLGSFELKVTKLLLVNSNVTTLLN